MLVLALQFSKGSERGRTHAGYLTNPDCSRRHWQSQIVRGTPWAAGAVSSMPGAEGPNPLMGRLPQNGREDKARRAGMSRGRILRLTCHFGLPTNAPTGSGSNRVGRMPTND
jgi:hypothetical protein